jgi:hypothetical protein
VETPIAAFAWEAKAAKQVEYVAADGSVHELYFADGASWQHTNAWSTAVSLPAVTGQIAGNATGSSKYVVGVLPSGHVDRIATDIAGNVDARDLTSVDSANPRW